jgi:hypothetical protein
MAFFSGSKCDADNCKNMGGRPQQWPDSGIGAVLQLDTNLP